MGKAEEYADLQRLEVFAGLIETEVDSSSEPLDRMACELVSILAEMRQRFGRDALNEEITRLELFAEGNPDGGFKPYRA